MRIKTSGTLKSIDDWKTRAGYSQHKYLGMLSILLSALGAAKAETLVVSMFIVALSLDFAFAQLAFLILLGFLLLKLQAYRFANLFLRIGSVINPRAFP